MQGDNARLIQSLYAAFAKGEVPEVLAAFDPQIVWNEAENFPYSDGNPYCGPDSVLHGVLARLGGEWDYFRVEADELLDAGNTVVVTGRYKGRHKASQASLDAQFVHVWKVRNGKVTQFQQYTDTAQAQRVFGSAGN